ncbi:MAG TPA: ABC transporter ATP-binding protein [Ktedonobacteraceae bacterium]|jgi:ABC-2 type transport system ATP-binding protein
METPAYIIEAHDLHRSFGAREAVAGISFCVQRGEIFGLLGPNGAGKTTTIRMLTGQIDPSKGSASVAGYDVVKERAQLKTRIGVVFEEQNLYERLSARLNLEFSCWLYGLPKRRVNAVLDLVDLRERARDPVRAFSSGMKQRLMVARALLHQPQVLFLDEPTRGLDPVAAHELRETITQLSHEGMTILLTTHLMEEADHLCQRLAFLVKGRIVANDTPRNLKLSHGERKLVVTLAPPPSPRGESSALIERTLSMDAPADQAQLAQWMAQGSVRAIHSREATLEEIFMSVAGEHLA